MLCCPRCRAREHAAKLVQTYGDLPADGGGFFPGKR